MTDTMSDLIAFRTYKTERLILGGQPCIVMFTRRVDQDEFALFAASEVSKNTWRCFYSPEVAKYFESTTGGALESHVYELLRHDIEAGLVQSKEEKK